MPGYHPLSGATSAWQGGYIIDENKTQYYVIIVWAGPADEKGQNIIGMFLDSAPDKYNQKYTKTWTPPQKLAPITITGISDIFGILSFKDATGKVGTLNLTTGAWVIK